MRWTKCVAVVVILSLISGCTSYKFVSIDGSPQGAPVTVQQIVPGDKVRLTLNSGEKREFFVSSVEADRIVGEGQTHAFDDIQFLEVRRVDEDGNNTVIAVVLVVGLLAILLIEAIDDSFDCIAGDC